MKKILLLLFLYISISYSQNTDDKLRALNLHNQVRADVGSIALVWSDKLEKDALNYAKVLARTNNFKHSNSTNGENLTTSIEWEENQGVRKYIYSETPLYDASLGWYEEIRDYRYSKVREFRLSAKIVGHYTQMVWIGTKQVGIASAISKDGNVYVVARYYPAGNIIGQFPY
jgi:uncharacterized protein YkwD